MQKNKRFFRPFTGGSSLLVIFAVLCFTVFTLLALGTAQADNRLAEASIQAVSDYYNADLAAETILAQLRQGIIPEDVQLTDNVYSYSCPISDTQVLMVEVIREEPTSQEKAADDAGRLRILRWQAISTIE